MPGTNLSKQMGSRCFISVHVSSAAASATGFETFIHPITSAKTKALQNMMHYEILDQIKGEGVGSWKEASKFSCASRK